MNLGELDFDLPPEQIAQEPLANRAASRLMVLDRAGERAPEHRSFADVVELIAPGSVLVLNETRVIPARFLGRRASGGKVELLLVRPLPPGADGVPGGAAPEPSSRPGEVAASDWEALVRTGGSLRPPDEVLTFPGRSAGGAGEEGADRGAEAGARVRVVARLGGGRYRVRFAGGEDALAAAERCGEMPLPPYIRRAAAPRDQETYQTVFARVPGAIAAPTAGLHFTPPLLAALEARGVTLARVVLHVGPGTFLPIRTERVEDHVLEAERYEVPPAAQEAIASARDAGHPVVACGTTAVRALEAYARSGEPSGATDLFIRPPFQFALVDALITNFHLPRSTLLLLVSALAGKEAILAAYRQAVARGYRFYSYGDAMLIR